MDVHRDDLSDLLRDRGGPAAILAVLRARGIGVSDEARHLIEFQEDQGTLERWLEKAVVATSIEDVIGDPS